MRIRLLPRLALVASAMLAFHAAPAGRSNADPVDRFTAFAVNLGDVGRAAAGTVLIDVDRYASDAERDRLVNVLLERGPDKLLDTIEEMPRMGNIRTPDSLGYPIRFARKTLVPEGGGERVTLVTNRPVTFWDAWRRPGTFDYPFTVIELRLDANGEGEGKLSIATRITGDKERGTITLENYATQPVMLTKVKREKP